MTQPWYPVPRLLPLTMTAMAALLVLKSATLVMAAFGAAPASIPAAAAAVPPAKAASPQPVSNPQVAKPVWAAPPNGAAPDAAKPESSPANSAVPAVTQSETVVSDSERALLTDLRERRKALDAREADLSARELALSAVEKRLNGRVDELTSLQARLETLEKQRRERDETSWRGLVKVYETMKPHDAAIIFNDLDLPVLLPVLDRMKESKAAPVLSAMLPERARQVTAELAQLRAKANSLAPGGPQPGPGG